MQTEPASETVESILAQFPGPVVLRQEQDKQAQLVGVGLLLTVFGAICLGLSNWTWSEAHYLLAGASLVTFGLHMTIGGAISVGTGGMWMKLDANGIEYRFWMRHQPRRWAWEAAKNFVVIYYGFKNSVVTFEASPKAEWWELNRILFYWGRQRLPNVTNLNDEDLAQLLNLWRARALHE